VTTVTLPRELAQVEVRPAAGRGAIGGEPVIAFEQRRQRVECDAGVGDGDEGIGAPSHCTRAGRSAPQLGR